MVFIFSGFLHELLVGVPTHNILGVAFVGMVVQLPLIWVTSTYHRSPNCLFHALMRFVAHVLRVIVMSYSSTLTSRVEVLTPKPSIVPLEKMQGSNGRLIGNCIFWVSFCLVGQPLAALLYFFAWQAKYGSVSGQNIR